MKIPTFYPVREAMSGENKGWNDALYSLRVDNGIEDRPKWCEHIIAGRYKVGHVSLTPGQKFCEFCGKEKPENYQPK